MKKHFLSALMITGSFLFMSLVYIQKKNIKIYLIGDSTMAKKSTGNYPETGWGMPFTYFFDSTVTVDNRAQNGRSTKSFMAEKRWQPVVDGLNEGDYVLIQFGHNDEVPTKKSATTPEEFTANLAQYVTETKRKKAIPVLITPVARRKFDSTGKLESTHEAYSALVRKVADQQKVLLIDLDKKSQEVLQQWGVEKSKLLFLHLEPGEHPNYPGGKTDDTHFSELGARIMAQLVLKELRSFNLELNNRIVKRDAR
jgi:lysophospholipase L1-like esterase